MGSDEATTPLFERTDGGGGILVQGPDGCRLLDHPYPACRLQRHGGLEALPVSCRNFPRSVVITPTGIEVAFQMDCPTVCTMVVDQPQPFGWTSVLEAGWPYPPIAVQDSTVRWDHGLPGDQEVTKDFEALTSIRTAWWKALDEIEPDARSGWNILKLLASMAVTPEAVISTGEVFDTPPEVLERSLPEPAALQMYGFLSRLPGRGTTYEAAYDRLLPGLTRMHSLEELACAAQAVDRCMLSATGLLLQNCGVHDLRPVLEGLRQVGQQMSMVLVVFDTLSEVAGGSTRDRLVDTLTATSHLWRLQDFATLKLID